MALYLFLKLFDSRTCLKLDFAPGKIIVFREILPSGQNDTLERNLVSAVLEGVAGCPLSSLPYTLSRKS